MRTFVSYSFRDSDLYIITMLFEELRRNGFTVESSDFANNRMYNEYKISNSDYFIGIITNNSESINEVIQEWQVATRQNIRAILLIEQNVQVQNLNAHQFIRFNRTNPQAAINQLLQMTRAAENPVNELGNAVAFGAIIIGLAALLSVLSGKSK